jgi:hypothetical protein
MGERVVSEIAKHAVLKFHSIAKAGNAEVVMPKRE